MSAAPWLLNTAWMLKCGIEWAAFAHACRDVAAAQERILARMLRANRDTQFGRLHDFGGLADVRTFQRRVPLSTYDDYADHMRRIGDGEANVLTRDPVRLLEPTSGTTGGEKLIPYTAGLRRQFQRGVAAWIANLFRGRPAVRGGRAYWSISPMLGPPRHTPGGLPIGFEDDAAYLGWMERFALRRLLVAPAQVARIRDMESFRYCTLLSLLAAEDLTLISVWSPTFLTSLLAPLGEWGERLCHDLGRGNINPPTPLPRELHSALEHWLRPNPARAERLARILRSDAPWSERLRQVWPRLALISCWTDAASTLFVPEVRALFPDVEIQPKGLLATEGFVSFPLVDRPGAALALRCHFFEFEEQDGSRCRLAHELDRGGRYRVVLTTAGGLYRYQMRDEVEIVGFHRQCPLLRFVGKCDATSDLVGEKLQEAHVRVVVDRALARHVLNPRFALLVPVLEPSGRYRLYLQGPGIDADAVDLDSLRAGLEDGLNENPYYRHAVAAGQLAPLDVIALDPEGESAWLRYEKRCIDEGQKPGNIKPVALDRRLGWPAILDPLQGTSPANRR